jgi:ribonuclease P protein component
MPENRKLFPKRDRLCNLKAITTLFESGESCFSFPMKFFYLGNGLDYNRILISVPKRNHKRAVERNLLKRRIKECWRLNKEQSQGINGLDIAIVYISPSVSEYIKIEKSLRDGLAKIKEGVAKTGLSSVHTAD